MSKALIVYGSTTGNTETAADYIAATLQEKGIDVVASDAADVEVKGMGEGYDLLLLGSSTWGDDEIEFQDDFVSIYENLGEAALKGRKVAVFGCGDSSYMHFCGAVNAMEEKVGALGGVIIGDPLKIDGDPERSEIVAWAETVAATI